MTIVSDQEHRAVSTELTKARYNRIAPLYNRYKEGIPVLRVDRSKLFKYRTNKPDLMKSLSRRLSSR